MAAATNLNRLTDFDKIWHADASLFKKSKMAATAILKIRKIAISPQQDDRF